MKGRSRRRTGEQRVSVCDEARQIWEAGGKKVERIPSREGVVGEIEVGESRRKRGRRGRRGRGLDKRGQLIRREGQNLKSARYIITPSVKAERAFSRRGSEPREMEQSSQGGPAVERVVVQPELP